MSRTGRPSSVETHPARARIEAALDAGETYESIRAWAGVSVSSLSRFSISRKSQLAKLVDGEPNVTDVILRAISIADDARDLRHRSKLTGTPVARARAIKTETEALNVLVSRLGIDDTAAEQAFEQTQELLKGLVRFVKTNPEGARALISTLRGIPSLEDLTDALMRQLKSVTP